MGVQAPQESHFAQPLGVPRMQNFGTNPEKVQGSLDEPGHPNWVPVTSQALSHLIHSGCSIIILIVQKKLRVKESKQVA